jgi:non-ribosomal peptide synthetase component F
LSFSDLLLTEPEATTLSKANATWHYFANPGGVSHVYFTSGSTGCPKGCVVSQQALVCYCQSKTRHLNITRTSRVLQASSVSFDPSLTDILSTLLIGACLVTSNRGQLLTSLAPTLQSFSITHLLSTPALLGTISFTRLDWVQASQLEVVALGGEACSKPLISAWCHLVRLVNFYGVTECCGYQSYCDLESSTSSRNLGQTFDTVQWFILPNVDLETAHDSHTVKRGELCLAGPQVGLGYLNQDELSNQRFAVDAGHGRYYRTGDMVAETSAGMKLLGRLDYQVKVSI